MTTRRSLRTGLLAALALLAAAMLGSAADASRAKQGRTVHVEHRSHQRAPATGKQRGRVHRVKMRTVARSSKRLRLKLTVISRSLTDGATVSGSISWQVKTPRFRVRRVEFEIDGERRHTDHAAPFEYGDGQLDTTVLSNGRHRLSATAYARGSRPDSASVTVFVANPASQPGPRPLPKPQPRPEPAPLPAPGPLPEPAPEQPAPPQPSPEPEPEPSPEPEPEPEPWPEPEPAPAPEPEPAPSPSPAPSRIYWGAWIDKHLTGDQPPWDMGAAEKFEEMAGKQISILNFSAPFANCGGSSCYFYNFPVNEMNAIRSRGSIPMYSWASQSIPSTRNQPDFQLADVIAGRYDEYIRQFAIAAREWGHPFFLRFNWEMNGSWFPWSERANENRPGEFVAAWRHVHDIFTAVGATNATWVWCPNVDPDGIFQDLDQIYPGDEYVDWTGLDGYNWGTNPAKPDRWRSFDQLYRSTYREITEQIAPTKPLIVSEMGSTEHGGSKAAWLADALAKVPAEYPKIRGLLYFEKYDDGMDWPIGTSSSSVQAFHDGIADPAYAGAEFGSLDDGKISPAS